MKKEFELKKARAIIQPYVDQLAEYCLPKKCVIAGSIRRERPVVGDAEIICQPTPRPIIDLFGTTVGFDYDVYEAVKRIFAGAQFNQNGPRKKQIILDCGLQVDLFFVLPPAQWGYRLAIATGPAQWNKYLVTPRAAFGAFPDGYFMDQGGIYTPKGELIEMPTEEDYFEFLGIPWVPPSQRRPPPLWVPF